jgi:hypothetical protein
MRARARISSFSKKNSQIPARRAQPAAAAAAACLEYIQREYLDLFRIRKLFLFFPSFSSQNEWNNLQKILARAQKKKEEEEEKTTKLAPSLRA